MNRIYLFLLILFPVIVSGQSRKIKGTLYTKDSICQGEGKPYKIKRKRCKDMAVFLSSDLYMSVKHVANTNRRGVFRIKLSPDELSYYKFLVFAGDSIYTSFISLDAAERRFSMELDKERIGPDYYYIGKPAVYLYPEKPQEVSVTLDFKGTLGTTFPVYNNGWKIIASPNGELTNLADNRKYNYLFWDGSYAFPPKHFDYQDGFVVKKAKLIPFLLSKLSQLGLNTTEINDFIIYWLPQLEQNEINFIHFWVNDDIDSSSFLNIIPKPDTQIVVFMEFKSVNASFKIKEQKLPVLTRKGFIVVEWGGSNLAVKKIE